MSVSLDRTAATSASEEQDRTESLLRCEPCDKTYTTERALQRHIRESRKHCGRICHYRCRECSKQFVRHHDYRRHVSEQHGQGKVKCPRCQKISRPGAPHHNDHGKPCSRETEAEIEHGAVGPYVSTATSTHKESDRRLPEDKAGLVSVHNAISGSSSFSNKSPEFPTRVVDSERIVCNLCLKPFEECDSSALRQHLDRHLQDFQKGYECVECEIVFVHETALQKHLSSARHYSRCGLDFQHQSRCTGHHRRNRPGVAFERDRFQFCVQLRELELTQLQVYLHRVNTLVSRYGPPSQGGEVSITFQPSLSGTTIFDFHPRVQNSRSYKVAMQTISRPMTSPGAWDSAQRASEVLPRGADQLSSQGLIPRRAAPTIHIPDGLNNHQDSSPAASSAAHSNRVRYQATSNVTRVHEDIQALISSLNLNRSKDDSSSEDTKEEIPEPTAFEDGANGGKDSKRIRRIDPEAYTRTTEFECDWAGILVTVSWVRDLVDVNQSSLAVMRKHLVKQK